MKSFLLVLTTFLFFSTLYSQDAIILQSGRKVEGVVIVKGNEVHLVSKLGTIIYDASTVKVVSNAEPKPEIDETKDKAVYDIGTFQPIIPISETLVTRSGRKLVGSVFKKGKEMFLSDLGGTVRIDPFVITPKEDSKAVKIRGEVISGEKCNVILTSGRSFSGIVVEEDDLYYVSTVLGTIKVDKKNVDHIQKTGIVLNFKEEEAKAANKAELKNAPAEAVNKDKIVDSDKNPNDMTVGEMIRINKKVEESLKEDEKKEIKTVFENE